MKNLKCSTTKTLVENSRKVRYMHREEPVNEYDSGWHFYCGDESDEYVDNTEESMVICDIQSMIDIDDSIEPYLESKTGSVFARMNDNDQFVERHFEKFGYVFATKMLVDNERKVMFMYRDKLNKTDNGDNSGWFFYCGDESQEYADNPQNWSLYDVRTIIGIDNSIVPYLSAPPRTVFKRLSDINDSFEIETDFNFDSEED